MKRSPFGFIESPAALLSKNPVEQRRGAVTNQRHPRGGYDHNQNERQRRSDDAEHRSAIALMINGRLARGGLLFHGNPSCLLPNQTMQARFTRLPKQINLNARKLGCRAINSDSLSVPKQ
jgi:hypothetical protein